MYTGKYRPTQSTLSTNNVDLSKSSSSTDKVDSVCEVVKAAVEKVDADRWAVVLCK